MEFRDLDLAQADIVRTMPNLHNQSVLAESGTADCQKAYREREPFEE